MMLWLEFCFHMCSVHHTDFYLTVHCISNGTVGWGAQADDFYWPVTKIRVSGYFLVLNPMALSKYPIFVKPITIKLKFSVFEHFYINISWFWHFKKKFRVFWLRYALLCCLLVFGWAVMPGHACLCLLVFICDPARQHYHHHQQTFLAACTMFWRHALSLLAVSAWSREIPWEAHSRRHLLGLQVNKSRIFQTQAFKTNQKNRYMGKSEPARLFNQRLVNIGICAQS